MTNLADHPVFKNMPNVQIALRRAAEQRASLTTEQRDTADALVQDVRDVLAQYQRPS